jgi:hypothetical protein
MAGVVVVTVWLKASEDTTGLGFATFVTDAFHARNCLYICGLAGSTRMGAGTGTSG